MEYEEAGRAELGAKNPIKLIGLAQAVYILKCFEAGRTEEQLVKEFGGDGQLIQMWINFMQHNHWMLRSESRSGWSATDKGKSWIYKWGTDN